MAAHVTLAEFINLDPTEQNEAWYDWFCRDSELLKRGAKLTAKLTTLQHTSLFRDTNSVMYKNNCPIVGALYDDMRIYNIDSGKTLYVIAPYSPRTKTATVYSYTNKFETPVVQGKWSEVIAFFETI